MKIDYLKLFNTFVQNAKKTGIVQKTGDESGGNSSQNSGIARQTPQTVMESSLLQAQKIKFNEMNSMEQAKLIKQLLNLPEDIEQLLKMLMKKQETAISDNFRRISMQNAPKINLDLIRQLLEINSKESADKLIKLFQQMPGGTQDTKQLKEILTLLNSLVPQKDTSHNETLTNLILLYLPWLPLAERQDLQIRIEERKNNEEEEAEEAAVIIYVTTIYLGRFKITVVLNKDNSIRVEIQNKKEKKNDKYEELLEYILKEINSQARKDKLNIKTELLVTEKKDEIELPEIEAEREVVISPVRKVSPMVIVTAQKIVKIILETDEKISLVQARKAMISGKD